MKTSMLLPFVKSSDGGKVKHSIGSCQTIA